MFGSVSTWRLKLCVHFKITQRRKSAVEAQFGPPSHRQSYQNVSVVFISEDQWNLCGNKRLYIMSKVMGLILVGGFVAYYKG